MYSGNIWRKLNMSFNFFDRVYCIHLPNERERKNKISRQFDSVGIKNVKYISATPPPPKFTMSNMRRSARGEFGVNLSQIKAIVHAIADGAERPLFFEDDIKFADNTIDTLNATIKQLPRDWGVLYLGGHPRGPVPARQAKQHSTNLWKIQRYSFADAYCINGDYLTKFYDYWCENITRDDAMYDFILGEFAGQNNGYSIYPTLCEQEPGISAVTGKHDNKDSILARAWATHIGPNNLTQEHKQRFEKWKNQNPGKWQQTLQRQANKL